MGKARRKTCIGQPASKKPIPLLNRQPPHKPPSLISHQHIKDFHGRLPPGPRPTAGFAQPARSRCGQSVSTETTLSQDTTDLGLLKQHLLRQSARICRELQDLDAKARVLFIKIKYAVSYYYNGQNLVAMREATDPLSSMAQNRSAIKGHYITNFTVRPLSMNIKWGWKFSLNVRMSDPMNVGTSDNPVAYLQADLNYIVSTPFSTNGSVWTYGVNGLGAFTDLTANDERMTKGIAPVEPVEVSSVSWN